MTVVVERPVGRRRTDRAPLARAAAPDTVLRPWGAPERGMEAWLRRFESEADLRKSLAWRRLLTFRRPRLRVEETVAAWRLLVLADALERDDVPASAPACAGVGR